MSLRLYTGTDKNTLTALLARFNLTHVPEIVTENDPPSSNDHILLLNKPPHWIFVLKDTAEYFDSFGCPPHTFYILRLKNSGHLKPNARNAFDNALFQSPDTSVCGEYCVAYAIMRDRLPFFVEPIRFVPSDWYKNSDATSPVKINNDKKILHFSQSVLRN